MKVMQLLTIQPSSGPNILMNSHNFVLPLVWATDCTNCTSDIWG